MSEWTISEGGGVMISATVHGDTLDAVNAQIQRHCRAFFGHHSYEVVQIDAKPIDRVGVGGGGSATWMADFEARMVEEGKAEA